MGGHFEGPYEPSPAGLAEADQIEAELRDHGLRPIEIVTLIQPAAGETADYVAATAEMAHNAGALVIWIRPSVLVVATGKPAE